MKKALLINGSPHQDGCTFTALSELQKALSGAGVASDLLWLGTKPTQDCTSCGHCETTGRCVFGDQVNEVLDQLDDYGAIVAGSPVYYSGATGRLCSFLDRLFYVGSDRMAGKLGAAVVSCRRGGSTASFERLNQYFLISNMFVVGSQYWNQVHGSRPTTCARTLRDFRPCAPWGSTWPGCSVPSRPDRRPAFPRRPIRNTFGRTSSVNFHRA